MIKLFVSDIDGTLMDRSKQIRTEDIEAIRLAHRQGVHICLASGRMHEEIKVVMELLAVPCYAVCQNGATIVDRDGTVIRASQHVIRVNDQAVSFELENGYAVLSRAWSPGDQIQLALEIARNAR